MTATILLVDPSGPEARAMVAAGRRAGHRVHALSPAGQPAGSGEVVLDGEVAVDFGDPQRSFAEGVRYARAIDASAVLTSNEYLTPLAARLAAALGLPGNDPGLAEAARCKAAMAAAFARGGVATPRTVVATTFAEVRAALATGVVGFPCVVKPSAAAGSIGVVVAADLAEASAAFTVALGTAGMHGVPAGPQVIVQELVRGEEFSVESITQAGRTRHLCVTRKSVTTGRHRVEVGHTLPAALPTGIEEAVLGLASRAIAACGITDSASHTEVIVAADGRCVVLETAARLGAGHIGTLIGHALGIDAWQACLDTALGRPAHLDPTRQGHAAIRFVTSPQAGRLTAITGLPIVGGPITEVYQRRCPGDLVTAPSANRSRLASFIVTGPDEQTTTHLADHLLGQARVRVEGAEP